MRYAMWVLKLVLFLLVLAFAIRNADPVVIHFYAGAEWQAPLVFVLLIAFCAGVAAGLAAVLGQVFRQRREIAALKRELGRLSPGGAEDAAKKPEWARA